MELQKIVVGGRSLTNTCETELLTGNPQVKSRPVSAVRAHTSPFPLLHNLQSESGMEKSQIAWPAKHLGKDPGKMKWNVPNPPLTDFVFALLNQLQFPSKKKKSLILQKCQCFQFFQIVLETPFLK